MTRFTHILLATVIAAVPFAAMAQSSTPASPSTTQAPAAATTQAPAATSAAPAAGSKAAPAASTSASTSAPTDKSDKSGKEMTKGKHHGQAKGHKKPKTETNS
ncbi:MAG: hypothetical protein U1F33_02735 [Alphaproteobacteria bacterium]